ncbi:hypothetical protein FGL89_05310 [Leuconostoc carnosum]|uniref:Uncharacterized protein n=1 Tax=Leuconostoc carnosum TaxID=1252 RepID=A0AAE6IJN9_LEUCA|nr:hypothetical protein [Leuconostoc carnosum]QEA33580.1 hypothetical protein FGL89_05310 [Leuconostoc carnosum]
MFLIGLVGLVVLFYMALVGLWKLIPWLVLAVIVTSILGFILEHVILLVVILIILVVALVVGNKKE